MSQKDLSISEMQKMQLELYKINQEKWNDMEPQHARDHILYGRRNRRMYINY